MKGLTGVLQHPTMNLIVGWEQPAFLHQSGPAIPALTVDNQCSPLYIQRLLKAKGPKRQGNGVQGERPYPKRRKGRPLARHQDTHMLSLFQRKRPPVAAAPSPAPVTDLPKGLLQPESAASLLATPKLGPA